MSIECIDLLKGSSLISDLGFSFLRDCIFISHNVNEINVLLCRLICYYICLLPQSQTALFLFLLFCHSLLASNMGPLPFSIIFHLSMSFHQRIAELEALHF